jgi:rod shape-determining protein MreC
MESFFSRYRNFLVLLVVLLAQIIGLATQVHRSDSGRNSLDPQDSAGVRLIRLWANAVVTPPERLFHASKLGIVYYWQNYVNLGHVRAQNQDLQKNLDRMRLEQAELLEDAKQGQRLQALMGFQEKYIYKTVAAQNIGSSGSDQSRVFYIDKGFADGLARDMAVITPDGIVGKVREVFPHTAQVLVINDQTSGAGVILETTRIRGILRGNTAGQPQIVGIQSDQRIRPGERVFTAGGDQIFPRGLPVGVVQGVKTDPERDPLVDVIIKPAAHLNRLDEVLVITSIQPRFSPEQAQDLATSEALKGAEAEAIKEQQKASQMMAERLPGLTNPSAAAPNQTATPQPGQPAQTGQNKATPPAQPASNPKLMPSLHSDRFSPVIKPKIPKSGKTSASTDQEDKPASKPETQSGQPATPRRSSQP